ncbi:MAG: hypothetical protein ACTSYD_02095 [Candidatus Heimdallarchaeaceae archaeon]
MINPKLVPSKKKKIRKKYESVEERRNRMAGKEIMINNRVIIDVSNPTQAANFVLDGASGDGKSYTMGIIANQFKDAIIFDVMGGAEKTLEEQGVLDEWEYWSLGYKARQKTKLIKINVSSLYSTRILHILRDEFKSRSRREYMKKFRKFFSLPATDRNKNYANFKKLCESGGFDFLLDELDAILSPTDEGMRISDFLRGKKIINVESVEQDNRSLPILFNSFFYHRTHGGAEIPTKSPQFKKEIEEATKNRLLLAVDDAQMTSSIFKKTIGDVFSLARKFNISALASGTNLGQLEPKVKMNANILFVFSAMYDEDTLRSKLGLWDIDFYQLAETKKHTKGEKGWCYFWIRDHPIYGRPKLIRPSLAYLEETEIPEIIPEVNLTETYGKLALHKINFH